MDSIDLTGLEIYDMDGICKIQLDGQYSIDALTSKIITEWIQLCECQADCGRSDYCKFACGEDEEIRCGIVSTALENFVKATFNIFSELPFDSKQKYLDGTFYLAKYIFETEVKLGIIIYDGFMKFYGRYAPIAFTSLINQREILNNIGNNFKFLPELNIGKGILFVEGKTELTFLSEMRKSNLNWFINLLIKSYDGKDNARPRRIEMLIKDHKDFGYKVYIQGDGDGKNHNIFQELINKNLVDPQNTFAFPFDFESAIRDDVFFKALIENDIPINVSFEEYEKRVSSSPFGQDKESVRDFISREYEIDIEDYKIPLAKSVAKHYGNVNLAWWHDNDFMNTVFGRFLKFIINIPR
ncbi:MAG: hypothetical protein JSU85_01605 [Candidatus Zixiibacteriota bacterium]|nr:MAG: hypothetical protein JSU85_01605 [candidate division Zixibacteria bacterium]